LTAEGEVSQPLLQLLQGIGLEPVIDPTALLAIHEEATLLQDFEMEGQLRLGQAQIGCEITNAALAASQDFDQLEADRLR
jgi:hypothetical protein